MDRKDSPKIVIDGFQSSGYEIEHVSAKSVTRVSTVPGQLIRCIDPRVDNRTPAHALGPAVPGAIFGLAFLMQDSSRTKGILARLNRAIERVEESGFVPSVHGDLEKGKVKGCKFLYALTKRVFPEDELTEEQILDAINANGIRHRLLDGGASPIGFAVNFNPDTTIVQKRKKYSADIWYLDRLGLDPENYTPKLVAVADLLLTSPNRRLIVPS